MAKHSTIFVQIASYRDPECQHTVQDLFAKAAFPERVNVGICWQFDAAEDQDCFQIPYPYPDQVRVLNYSLKESKGAGWARSEANSLWQGEDYVLNIDSHMRFARGWDEKLIAMLESCPSQKAVLSTCLPGYLQDGSFKIGKNEVTFMRVHSLDKEGGTQPVHLTGGFQEEPDKPFPAAMVIQNFIFGRAETFREVPIDPYIYFYGDEISYSARLWTHGYDIYQPNRLVLAHQWDRAHIQKPQTYKAHAEIANQQSHARVLHLLGIKEIKDKKILKDIGQYGLGVARTLEAYWKFSGIDLPRGVLNDRAKAGEWTQQGTSQGKQVSNKDRIFVQIASYRDPECQWTIKDLFEKASNPDRVFVGVVWQYVPEEDQDCFTVETRPGQVRSKMMHAKDSRGVCWARSETQKLWQGEEYTLQIDSHMRFEKGWDDALINMCRQTGAAKPVITCYPPGYTPPDKLNTGYIFSMGAKEFDNKGIFTMVGRAIKVEDAPKEPIAGVFCAAGFLFGPSSLIKDVPYDPYIYFFGEEISLAVRLWTHGYDLFYPNQLVIYHDWERKRRKTHFDDHINWGELNTRSIRRVHHLLAVQESADPEVTRDIEKYGLGNERTLAEYQLYSGVDFAKRAYSEQAREGKAYPPFKRNSNVGFKAMINTITKHKPKKVYESENGVIYDDFLPEDVYETIYNFACTTDYEHINTKGKVARVWRIRDGFPLRSLLNLYYFTNEAKRPKTEWAYPTGTAMDMFAEHINMIAPEMAPFIGHPNKDWDRFTVTGWVYPKNTALSLHDDGSGVYSGAYAYFLNPYWDIHWGGLLMFLDSRANKALQDHKTPQNVVEYYKKKWIDPTDENAFVWDPGLAQCVFPKRNRIAFIHPDAYHFVTKVYEDAGDNCRMSFAGFFHKPEKEKK